MVSQQAHALDGRDADGENSDENEHVEDGKVSLRERAQQAWMKFRRGSIEQRFNEIAGTYRDVVRDSRESTGREQAILSAYMDFRSALKQAEVEAHAIHEQAEAELALWSRCAEVRAESLRSGELSGPLTRSDRGMRRLLEQRRQRRAELREHIEAADESADSHDQMMPELQQRADAAQQRLKRAQAALSERLASDANYQRLVARRSRIRDALSGLEKRLEHALAERDRKSGSYTNDPLFRHLRKRGYGTRDYRRKGLAYRMDRWVAAVSHYQQALRDYELLQDMPRSRPAAMSCTRSKKAPMPTPWRFGISIETCSPVSRSRRC